MPTPRFIWDLRKEKKIKVKEIREHNIKWNETLEVHEVIVFGFFGGGVVIFQHPEKAECEKYIDNLTGESNHKEE